MSSTKRTLFLCAILAVALSLNLLPNQPETGTFVYTIGTVTYGSNAAACYLKCKKGEFCTFANNVASCKPYCGDGIVVGAEASPSGCDDGNTVAGDGCNKCKTEFLWSCQSATPGAKSVCTATCGNGAL